MTEKDLFLMGLALRLKKQLGKDVCLAVPVKQLDRVQYHSSITLEGAFVGHTALFNLVQHLDWKAPTLLKQGAFYLTCEPKPSDIGIFIMRCNLGKSDSMLFFLRDDSSVVNT